MAAHELYLIRHGLAEERGDAWPDDTRAAADRRGHLPSARRARAVSSAWVSSSTSCSRARWCARGRPRKLFAAAFNTRPPLVVIDSLAPEGSVQAVMTDLEKHARRARIALVGHEPGIGELAARLIGSRHPLEFKKGAVCRIDVESIPPAGPGDAALVPDAEDPARAPQVKSSSSTRRSATTISAATRALMFEPMRANGPPASRESSS